MPSSRLSLGSAVVLLVITALRASDAVALLTFLFAFIAIVGALLQRPRERKARLVRSLAAFGSHWGAEIGPPPGQGGPAISGDGDALKLMRAYVGSNEFEYRTRQAADRAALELRGYVPVAESFVDARWRSADWLAALVFLVFVFPVGIVILIYMASNRPGGTLTVTYERQSAGGTGIAGTANAADEAIRRPAERLRSLDHLRDQGQISVDEWTTRRRMILAEI
jgi:hypothetical protein